ncbi:class I SAM-dependent methyltransferase [Amycolatopsis sp. WGS_07]|uniref:class I SAM-dependent methyltransferase n=1 Tax=Amycolatopsis sp. WGS_07 TaxID=3076764 RepID=UPI003873B36B
MRWFFRGPAASEEVVPSPNIWYHQHVYDVENRAQDADGDIWRVLREESDWTGRDVLDLGCGDGYHLPFFAADARSVLGIEPHPPLARDAERRVRDLGNVRVRLGRAQQLPVDDASVDIVHARTAYFFGPGCEPGLREAERVLRPGGSIVIVDLDVTSEPYGGWMRADLPHYDPPAVERFFAAHGFNCRRVRTRWRFADFVAAESVLKIEFSAKVAQRAIADTRRLNPGSGEVTLPVGYRVHCRVKPTGLVLPGHSAALPESPASSESSTSPRIE